MMNLSGIRRFGSVKEWIDKPDELSRKIKTLAYMIKKAKYPIFFTGAGCSTSIGIPDYRSGHDTVVESGPGIWNRSDKPKNIEKIVDIAEPSPTHMAIKTLLDKNIFKFLVSQNTDGLHLRSGVSRDKIAELHGNRNLEQCPSCNTSYLRDFRTLKSNKRTEEEKRDHRTGRICENCMGELYDSIIYFGEKLPKNELIKAYTEAGKADFCLCIGSSLTVKPSMNIPILVAQKGQISIINIQQTPLDENSLKINQFCDMTMKTLMEELNIPIDEYFVQHWIELSFDGQKLEVTGKDRQGKNFSNVTQIQYEGEIFHSEQAMIHFSIHHEKTITIKFHGRKPLLQLNLNEFYKIFHGETLLLNLVCKKGNKEWAINEA